MITVLQRAGFFAHLHHSQTVMQWGKETSVRTIHPDVPRPYVPAPI